MRGLPIAFFALLVAGCGSDASSPPPLDGDAASTPDSAVVPPDAADAALPLIDAGPDPKFDSAIYTTPKQRYDVPKVGDAIDAILGARPAVDHLIFFVHGRACGGGGEPDKSLAADGAVPELEKAPGAAVLMFNWPGADAGCPLGFPETQARAAGPALRFMLSRVELWAKTHPAARAKLGLTLLTHSMGNFVLESALGPGPTGLDPSLFGTTILNSSATALAKHALWLARLDFSAHVYVTVNSGDKVLLAATSGFGPRLGKQLDAEPLTSRAAYVDFSAAGVNHEYFVPTGQKGQNMAPFYGPVLAGKPYDFQTSKAIDHTATRDGATIYSFLK